MEDHRVFVGLLVAALAASMVATYHDQWLLGFVLFLAGLTPLPTALVARARRAVERQRRSRPARR
jgi:hypothetical protein